MFTRKQKKETVNKEVQELGDLLITIAESEDIRLRQLLTLEVLDKIKEIFKIFV